MTERSEVKAERSLPTDDVYFGNIDARHRSGVIGLG